MLEGFRELYPILGRHTCAAPIATCGIQRYVYDAKRRCARLARRIWNDPDMANRLENEAAELKVRFNRDFWIADKQYFALALDGKKQKVDSRTSNLGHLLWSGIVDKAESCSRQLLRPRLFSGWGIRTMAEGEGGYNPIGYHIGTLWPLDNSLVPQGLRNYEFDEQAATVIFANLETGRYFDYRFPEAFAGYPRVQTQFPVEYPTACSPQAWSCSAPLLFLRTMFGLEPVGKRLLVDPAVPKQIERLELLGIHGRWHRADVFARELINIPSDETRFAVAQKPPRCDCANAVANPQGGETPQIRTTANRKIVMSGYIELRRRVQSDVVSRDPRKPSP